jgi:aminoglycoside phosphotransferase family enzyme
MPSQPEGVSNQVAVEVKVAFLRRPDAYPEQPKRVETVETHMSWVFLADGYAYKLKKPVCYDFLDFSTLDARRRDSEEEVRLNRRLAPDVYLGTVPLTLDAQGQLRLGGDGEIVDWLVRMRRLPAERMLDHGIRRRTVTEADVARVAESLARFYLAAPPVELTPAAYRQRLVERVNDNLRELASPAFGLPQDVIRAVSSAQLALIEREPGLFDRRVEEKRIVEGHGDLRPEHVCLEPPLFIDCLEFQRDYRILDAADEVAFLALECERLGGAWVGDVLFRTYGEIAGDHPPEKLLHFYRSYRACLRAKIAIWHLKDPGMPNPERWSRRAMEYLGLAEQYAQGL